MTDDVPSLPRLSDPERELALAYVPARNRDRLRALWAIDENFGAIVAGTSEPAIGEMRLLWWRERLEQLGGIVPAEPLLQAVAKALGERRGEAAQWGAIAEGWFALIDGEIDRAALARFADARGGALFALSGGLLGCEDARLRDAGRGWALVDLARRASDRALAERALGLAVELLNGQRERWPKPLRPLGMLAALARRDASRGLPMARQGAPGRIARMVRHRWTGR